MCLVGRRAICNGIDDGKRVKNINHVQNDGHVDGGAKKRKRNFKEFIPEIRTVDHSSLIIITRNALQTGQERKRHEWNCDDDADNDHPCERTDRVSKEVDRFMDKSKLQQQRVERAIFIVQNIFPCSRRNQQRRCPWQEQHSPVECASFELLIENKRHNNAQHNADADNGDRPNGRVDHNTPENLLSEQILEVLQRAEFFDQVCR